MRDRNQPQQPILMMPPVGPQITPAQFLYGCALIGVLCRPGAGERPVEDLVAEAIKVNTASIVGLIAEDQRQADLAKADSDPHNAHAPSVANFEIRS